LVITGFPWLAPKTLPEKQKSPESAYGSYYSVMGATDIITKSRAKFHEQNDE